MSCKEDPSPRRYISVERIQGLNNKTLLSKSDNNKLTNFLKDTSKYAIGTDKAKEKVMYLDSIKHNFDKNQLLIYTTARKKYDIEVAIKSEKIDSKLNINIILNNALSNHKSVKIRYKGLLRKIDPYILNDTYVVANCHFAHDIRTFRIDKIQEIEMVEGFDFDKSIQSRVQPKLFEAPNYKGFNGYKNRY